MSIQTSDTSTQLEHESATDTSTASTLETIRRLQQRYDELTGPVRILNEDVEAGRREVREWDLDERTAAKVRHDALTLLDELSTMLASTWWSWTRQGPGPAGSPAASTPSTASWCPRRQPPERLHLGLTGWQRANGATPDRKVPERRLPP
jgi:hypothetical protein